jgi:phosphatidylglycerol:prolipoprotein diacylglycerol transferase
VIRLPVLPALHTLFETLGYALGYAAYKRARLQQGDVVAEQQRWSVIAAAAVGALVGSRALGLLEQAPRLHITLQQALLPGGGKTIVGGLLGGWIGVELVKWAQGIRSRTGDLFAIPLCIGIAVGRVGCLLAGLADDTYGTPTTLPWGVDFGDGIGRHPTQAYEIVFLLSLIALLQWMAKRPHANGALFRVFLFAYLGWRLVIDFIKPQPLVGGLNWIQWSCIAGILALIAGLRHNDVAVVEGDVAV